MEIYNFTLSMLFLWARVVVVVVGTGIYVCMHVEATEEHQLTSSISFCLVALRQGLSLIQKLAIIARLPGQQAQDPTVSGGRSLVFILPEIAL